MPSEAELRDFLSRLELLSEPITLSPRKPGMAFADALEAATDTGCSLISSRLAYNVLYKKNAWRDNASAWPLWTGTVLAFPASGMPIGDSIEWEDKGTRYFIGTKSFRGLKGAALMLESGSYALVRDGSTEVFLPSRAPLIARGFPQTSGWFGVEELTGLPSEDGPATVRFSRTTEGRVIPVAADYYYVFEGKRHGHAMSLHIPPSSKLGVLVSQVSEHNYPRLIAAKIGSEERAEFLALISEWVERDDGLSRAVADKFHLLGEQRSFFQNSQAMESLARKVRAPR
ncbi:MAG TPA: hypothetical protein VLD37_00130 [Candidatus Bilamarchaeum sp.]|nr:hypothetical protein [Candidatus Bilamarchaeum sp.]